jgi:uncharacterized protein YbjT (DUF2867 family)
MNNYTLRHRPIVTGGAGFRGTHLLRTSAGHGYDVIAPGHDTVELARTTISRM